MNEIVADLNFEELQQHQQLEKQRSDLEARLSIRKEDMQIQSEFEAQKSSSAHSRKGQAVKVAKVVEKPPSNHGGEAVEIATQTIMPTYRYQYLRAVDWENSRIYKHLVNVSTTDRLIIVDQESQNRLL